MSRFSLRMATNNANKLRENKIIDSEIARSLEITRQAVWFHMKSDECTLSTIRTYAEVFGLSFNEFQTMGIE